MLQNPQNSKKLEDKLKEEIESANDQLEMQWY